MRKIWAWLRTRVRPTHESPEPAAPCLTLRMLCHELRSPIDSLRTLTRALADETDAFTPAERRAIARLARDQATHLDGLWREAASLTRELTRPADPPAPLARVLPAAVAAVPPHRLRLHVTRAAADRPVDAQRVRQILGNLVENALRHGPPGGLIRVAASVRARWLVLVVADGGTSAHSLRAALRRPAPPTGLRGLGLWIVRSLVAAEGGTVAVRHRTGRGTAVEVLLPGYRSGSAGRPAPRAGFARWPRWAAGWPRRVSPTGSEGGSAVGPDGRGGRFGTGTSAGRWGRRLLG